MQKKELLSKEDVYQECIDRIERGWYYMYKDVDDKDLDTAFRVAITTLKSLASRKKSLYEKLPGK